MDEIVFLLNCDLDYEELLYNEVLHHAFIVSLL